MLIKFISLITFPIFARYFLPSDYGVIGILSSLSLMLVTISNMGLDSASFRFFYDTEDPQKKNEIFITAFFGRLFLALIISLITLIVFKWTPLRHVLPEKDGIKLLLLILANLFLNIIPTLLSSLCLAYRKPVTSLFLSILITVLSAGSGLLLVIVFKAGVYGFFAGQGLAWIVATLIGIVLFFVKVKSFQINVPLLKEMLIYGAKLTPSSLSNNFLLFFATLIIKSYTSLHDLGIFQVGYTLSMVIMFFSSGFAQAYVPYSLSLKDDEFRDLSVWILDVYCSAMSFISFVIVVFLPQLIYILLPPVYLQSYKVAGVLTFANFVTSIGTIASISFSKTKKVGIYSFIIVSFQLFQLLLIVFLSKQFGIIGAAFSFLIINLISVAALFYFSNRILFIPFRLLKNTAIIFLFLASYFLLMKWQPQLLINILVVSLTSSAFFILQRKNLRKTVTLIKSRFT